MRRRGRPRSLPEDLSSGSSVACLVAQGVALSDVSRVGVVPVHESTQPVSRLTPGRALPLGPEEDFRREENFPTQRPQAGQEPRFP